MGKRTVTTYTKVVIEKGSTDWIVECQHCRGSGQKYPGYGSTHSKREYQCPTCSGHGVLALATDRFGCGNCDGTGQKYPGYSKTHSKRKHRCNTCNGAGSNKI